MKKISTQLLAIIMLLMTDSIVSRIMGGEMNTLIIKSLRENMSERPDLPLSVKINDAGYDYISFSAASNANDDQIIVALTDMTQGLEDLFPTEDGVFGTPVGLLNVDDKIPGGGTVVYKGKAVSDIKINNLKDNTIYHLAVWSINSQNNYSSSSVKANGITMGKLPYEGNFENTPVYNVPLGWVATGEYPFRVVKQNSAYSGKEPFILQCNIETGNSYFGKEHTITTQWIQLNDAVNRLLFKYNFSVISRMGTMSYNWDDRDTLYVQVSKNEKDYTTIYTLNRSNYIERPNNTFDITCWGTVNIPFELFKGEKVKIRLKWKTFYSSSELKMLIESFVVEEKPECEYPVNVHVEKSSIVGSQALIGWTANDGVATWQIRYRKMQDEWWSKVVESETNSYLLTDLPSNSDVEVQVRSKCSSTSESPWSKAVRFKSGYSIPFTEHFNNIDLLPAGWSFKNGLLGSPTDFCDEVMSICPTNWSISSNKLRIMYVVKPKDWVITPKIDLGDGSYHGRLVFDLAMSGNSKEYITEDICFAVAVSKDGTFNKEDVILELRQADLATVGTGKQYAIDLSWLKGIIQLGFYAYSQSAGAVEILELDNISLVETCPSATNINVSQITSVSATVTWNDTAQEWLTFVRKAGETSKEYTKQAESKLVLTGLSPKTNYEIGITKSCNVGDTAKLVIATLITAYCIEPADIVATPTKKDVTIEWTGEATNYNVKFRNKNNEDSIVKTTQETHIVFEGLQENTEYEYSIQAVCNSDKGDMSEWTDIAEVMTLPETCFPPTQIVVKPTYKSAKILWEGEAEKYQLAYKVADTWITEEVVNGNAFDISSLIANTQYEVRLRSICAVGDTSSWSVITEFKTAQVPECSSPTNLRASGITDTGAILEWSANESNMSWDVRYCLSTNVIWTTIENLNVKTFEVSNLIPNSAYVWSVKASCDEGRTSAWISNTLTTNPGNSIKNPESGTIKVYISNKVINIQNPRNVKIERISLYGTNGVAIKEYVINSDENVMIPTNLNTDIVIVKVTGESFSESYMIYID